MDLVFIDNDQLLTESLTFLLQKCDYINEIQSYQHPGNYLLASEEKEPDIIIADILLPEINGIELIHELKKRRAKSKIIILSVITEIQTIRHAMRSGASGYLGKNIAVEELKQAILAVYDGESYVSENLQKHLVRNTLIEDRFVYKLSPREKEVLIFVCSGKTIKETAFKMGLSPSTVQTYFKTILKKFNLRRTAELIVFAFQNGMISLKSNNLN